MWIQIQVLLLMNKFLNEQSMWGMMVMMLWKHAMWYSTWIIIIKQDSPQGRKYYRHQLLLHRLMSSHYLTDLDSSSVLPVRSVPMERSALMWHLKVMTVLFSETIHLQKEDTLLNGFFCGFQKWLSMQKVSTCFCRTIWNFINGATWKNVFRSAQQPNSR